MNPGSLQIGAYGEPQLLLLALLAYSRDTARDNARVIRNLQRLSLSDHQWLGEAFPLADSIKNGISLNQDFFNNLVRNRALVADFQVNAFPESLAPEELLPYSMRVRQLLSAVAREWSLNGELERKQCFGLISDFVKKYLPSDSSILLPGASLGRLAHELAALDHTVTAVEDDMLKSLAYRFLQNGFSAEISPYILNTCNRREPDDNAVSLTVPENPDILKLPVSYVMDDFFAWATEDSERKFDAIVTSFFIDACETSIAQLCRIFQILLKQGGVWINVGSLTYSYEGDVRKEGKIYEASAEEVLMVAGKCGFEVLEHGFVKTTYAANPRSLMYSEHDALFFVARKI